MNEVKNGYAEQLQAAKRFIERHDDFLVVSHLHPDGDAISSTLAMGWLLRQLGKTCVLANADPVPQKFAYLWQSSSIVDYSAAGLARSFEYVVAVDCADFGRIGKVRESFAEGAQLLNIDHHPTNDLFGRVNVVRAEAAATAEMIYDLAKQFDVEWNRDFASCIYTGLLTDTGGFRYSNTTPKVLAIASEMLNYGVENNVLAEHLLEKMSYPQILLLKKALAGLTFTPDRKIAWVSVTIEDLAETEANNEDTEGLVNYPRNIEGVEVGILFKQLARDEIKVSLRSSGHVDVSAIAKSFGGGGHARAAGCTLRYALGEAIERTVKEVGLALK